MVADQLARAGRFFIPLLMGLGWALGLGGCDDRGDIAALRDMQLKPETVPASPTNAYAQDGLAAALGKKLFFDKRLSVDSTVACSSCHDPAQGFSDPRPFSIGVRGQVGDRHAMPITAAAFQKFTLWDGRGDSLWIQPLKAIENPKEMDLTRVELAKLVASAYKGEYEEVFGDLPSLQGAPVKGKPGMAEWEALPASLKSDIDRIAANTGKAIEAYERTLLCADTRFDRWARGEVSFTQQELNGARAFVDQGCTNCHSGPAFSDGAFHNIGLPSSDRGRALGRPQLLADPFNGAGVHSDNPSAGEAKLATVQSETPGEGAFRTASLRGAGQRSFFGHAAHQATLRGFISDVYRGGRNRRNATVGTLDPLMRGVNVPDREVDDLVAFLHTLDCPPPAP